MLLSTTDKIENMNIVEYKGLVFGEVVNGVDMIKDFAASIRDAFGGRSATYEKEVVETRGNAILEMVERAEKLDANAIVGIKIDYETIGQSMMMVIASGTAVKVE